MADQQLAHPAAAQAERTRAAVLEAANGTSLHTIRERLREARLPLPGSERWKYTPVNRVYERLIDALPGDAHHDSPFDVSGAASLRFDTDVALEQAAAEIDTTRHPLADALALASRGCWVLEVDGEARLSIATTLGEASWLRCELAPGAKLVLDETTTPSALSVIQLRLASGAAVTHSREATSDAFCWQLLDVDLAADTDYALHHLSFGSALRRHENHIRLRGDRATVQIDGALLCAAANRCDVQTTVEHMGRQSRSRQRYHGVAADAGKVTVGGRIHIHTGASGADAQLNNPNLSLSERAEINTKPELEIYEEDVTCSHGATVGKLDEDALFYLRSRGIPEAAAREALLLAFVRESITGPSAERAAATASAELQNWATPS